MEDIYGYLRYTANLIADSRFGDKLILKGGSVLMSKLIECDRQDLMRITRDIDIHCDKKDLWIDFYTNIEAILNNNNQGLIYKIIKRRSLDKGLDTSDSLKFNIIDTINNKEVQFKIDMNIKSNCIISIEYSPILNMNTYDAVTMLSDKIVVVSSEKIYRRIKDLYDLTVLSSLYDYEYTNIIKHIQIKNPNITLKDMLIPKNFAAIQHAYSLYRGIYNKPSIQNLVASSRVFLQPIYSKYSGELIWNHMKALWERV